MTLYVSFSAQIILVLWGTWKNFALFLAEQQASNATHACKGETCWHCTCSLTFGCDPQHAGLLKVTFSTKVWFKLFIW